MTDAQRLSAAKAEYTGQLREFGNVSFSIWLLDLAEAAEARAAMLQECLGPNARILNQRRDEQIKQLTAERDALAAENAEMNAAIWKKFEQIEQLVAERDELRRQLEHVKRQLREACNEVTDDVTRLQWLKSLIHEARCHINVLGDGDTDAVLTCLREAEDLHDALRAMLDGGAV